MNKVQMLVLMVAMSGVNAWTSIEQASLAEGQSVAEQLEQKTTDSNEVSAATESSEEFGSTIVKDKPADASSGSVVEELPAVENVETETVESKDSLVDQIGFPNDKMQAILKQLEEQMSKEREKMSPEKQEELDRLENEAKELGLKLNTLHAELEDFNATKVVQKSEVTELKEKIAALEAERAQLGDAVADESEDVATNRTNLDTEIASLKESLEVKRAAKKETKTKIAAHSEEIDATHKQMEEKQAEMPMPAFDTIDFDGVDFDSIFAMPEDTPDMGTEASAASSDGEDTTKF